MRAARTVIWAIGLAMVVSSVPTREAVGQQAQLAFRRGFVSSYVAAAIRHGRPAGPAEVEADCIYDIIAARMTVGQLAELVDEEHWSRPPAALAPLIPEIKRRCLHGDGAGPAMTVSGGSATIQPTAIDDADSAAVAHEVRQLRVAEEARLMAAGGVPVMLPTGPCTATVTVGSAGQPAPGFPVECGDERMQGIMRQAVTTAAPFRAAPGSVVRLAVFANDPEPGADPQQARLDIADSITVGNEVARMRMDQVRNETASRGPPPPPAFGHCSATVHVGNDGTPDDHFLVSCSDPRLEAPMRQALLTIGPMRARPGSTVLLRVNSIFPAP